MNKILFIATWTLSALVTTNCSEAQETQTTQEAQAPVYFTLSGKVIDLTSKKPVKNALVKLIPMGGISSETKTDKHGVYRFEEIEGSEDAYILPNSNYTIIVIKKGYDKGEDELSTVGVEESQDFELDFYLKKSQKQ